MHVYGGSVRVSGTWATYVNGCFSSKTFHMQCTIERPLHQQTYVSDSPSNLSRVNNIPSPLSVNNDTAGTGDLYMVRSVFTHANTTAWFVLLHPRTRDEITS